MDTSQWRCWTNDESIVTGEKSYEDCMPVREKNNLKRTKDTVTATSILLHEYSLHRYQPIIARFGCFRRIKYSRSCNRNIKRISSSKSIIFFFPPRKTNNFDLIYRVVSSFTMCSSKGRKDKTESKRVIRFTRELHVYEIRVAHILIHKAGDFWNLI